MNGQEYVRLRQYGGLDTGGSEKEKFYRIVLKIYYAVLHRYTDAGIFNSFDV